MVPLGHFSMLGHTLLIFYSSVSTLLKDGTRAAQCATPATGMVLLSQAGENVCLALLKGKREREREHTLSLTMKKILIILKEEHLLA